MEKFHFRRRRSHARVSSPSKVTTIIDRNSGDSLKENQVTGNQYSLGKLRSDFSSRSSDTSAEVDLFTVNWGRKSLRLSTGTPMKKLLADEMSKDTQSKRRSPSVIARLMGLDGLPPQLSSNKQQKRLSENYQQNVGSGGFSKSSKLDGIQSLRKSTKEQQRCIDVYEVAPCSNMETRGNTFHSAVNPSASDEEMAFIRQKFMDVKHCSTNEKLQHSKEFHDALDVLDSKKDILLKFLQEPNSLFSKHLDDLHDARQYPPGHVSWMECTDTLKCNIEAIGCQSGREASKKIDISHSHTHWDSCNGDLHHGHKKDSRKLNTPVEGKQDGTLIPTRIVVLKPNLGKAQCTGRSDFSPSPSHNVSDVNINNECSNMLHSGYESIGNRSAHNDFETYECKSREYGDVARNVKRRMRNKSRKDTFAISSFGHKGYSADESSCDTSENDSAYESDVTMVCSQISVDRSIHNKASTSNYSESSVNKEAKRRLSERWKMTCRSQEAGISGKSNTLAEMLATPEVGIRPRSPDFIIASDDCFRRYKGNDGTPQGIAPLGISSRDGWKDGCTRSLSRSRSLPASNHLGSPKSSTRRETLAAERFMVRKESIDHVTNAAIKMGSTRKDGSFSGSAKPRTEKFQSSYNQSMEITNDAHEVRFSWGRMAKSLHGKDSSEVKAVILETSCCRHGTSLSLNTMMDNKHLNAFDALISSDQRVPAPEIPLNVPLQVDSSACNLPSVEQESNYDSRGSSHLQCAATQPESPVSSKESEQPSPVSVLEAPFVEDLSSGSECFERVSAGLHGLRLQLQLLKLETEADGEGFMHNSSDEDAESPIDLHDCGEFFRVKERWDSSYLEDVLSELALDKTDPDVFLRTWQFSNSSIGPWVFENLEKKYGAWESCSRSERRFLFELINSRITEISQHFVDLHPWVKKLPRISDPQCQKDVLLKTELHKLLENHEEKATGMSMGKVIVDNMPWLEIAEHIDTIGKDIEGFLMHELVTELLPV